jgi:hypothetical protein
LAFWLLGAALGFSQAWTARFDADDNTVAYLDIGNNFFHGHYSAFINGFWSPLYSLLLSCPIAIFKPSLRWVYPTVHLWVFITFLLAMVCFDYFLGQLTRLRADSDPQKRSFSELDWVWITIAYTVFLWSSLKWIEVSKVTVEFVIAAFFYLSCGLLVAISAGRAQWKTFLTLGLLLGLTYLAKFILLPICLFILVIAWIVAKEKSRYVVISAIAFFAIAMPFITALSIQRAKFTYGERATYDYAVSVNRVPFYHYQGNAAMPLAHPTRKIFDRPATFAFEQPFAATYPPQYDISYWYEGTKPRVQFLHELKVIGKNLYWEFATLFFSLDGILLATLFLLLYETGRGWQILKDVLRYWFLLLPSLAMALLFASVFYLPEYLAASYVVLLVCLFFSAGFTVPKSRLLSGVAVLQLVMLIGLVIFPSLLHAVDIHPFHSRANHRASYQQVAEQAIEMGLKPGDKIASLNYSNEQMAMWAYLARVQIVAEVYYRADLLDGSSTNYWSVDPLTQKELMQKLAQTGARAVVTQDHPTGPDAARWLQMGTTGFYLLWLKPAA